MRRLIYGMIIGSVVAAATAAAAIYYYERPSVLRVAVPRDSYDQAIMAAAALDFAKDQADIRLKLIPVESLANRRACLRKAMPISRSCAPISLCRQAARPF